MSSLSRWLTWRPPQPTSENGPPATKPAEPTKPSQADAPGNGHGATKPTKPSKPHSGILGAGESEGVGGRHPEPTWLRTVDSWFAGGRTRMTICRHNLAGMNRFGQGAEEFPYCLVNQAEWKDWPLDLHAARWFRTREESIAFAEGRMDVPADAPVTSKVWSAEFAGGVAVELRLESGGRWLMWVRQNGEFERRKDFSTPHTDHGRWTAERWFGSSKGGWSPSPLPRAEECE